MSKDNIITDAINYEINNSNAGTSHITRLLDVISELEAENKELRKAQEWVEDMEPDIGLHVLTTEEYVNNKGKTITRVFENIYWGAGNWDEGEDDLIKKWRYMPKPPKEDV